MSKNRKVVVTGIGLVTPIGIGKENFWSSLQAGHSGIRMVSSLDTSNFRTRIGAEISNFNIKDYFPDIKTKHMDRFSKLAMVATDEMFKDAKLVLDDSNRHRIGVYIGTGGGGRIFVESIIKRYLEKGHRGMYPYAVVKIMPNAAAAQISNHYCLMGPSTTIVTACASSTMAIGEAYRTISLGLADAIVAGGTETPFAQAFFSAWDKMRIMSCCNDSPEKACRPFSLDRDGLVLGEGAGILLLEAEEHALARGAKRYARIIGYGTAMDGYHITQPNLDGEILAIKQALLDADKKPEEIDYINAHGTATLLNDKVETQAIKKVYGPRAYRLFVNSTKPMVGHTLGASGAIETAASVLCLQKGYVHPTINLDVFDPDCDLDYVPNTGRQVSIKVAAKHSFAFGGVNAVLILEKVENQ